jgi:hypothetical protein
MELKPQQEEVKVKVKLSLCLTKYHPIKAYWGVEVYCQAFLTWALEGSERSASRPDRFNPEERATAEEKRKRKYKQIQRLYIFKFLLFI